VAAKELSEAGMSVVVLERGPWYKRTDFLEDEILFKQRHFLWPTVKQEPRTWRPNDQTPAERLSHEVQLFSNAMCVGAGTIHYSGLSWRFHESDFRVKSADGPVAGAAIEDWPVSYDEMEPYYEKAEWTIGVSGRGWANPFDPPRKRDFPTPPLPRNSAGAILEKGGKALGLHPFPTPMAILSRAMTADRRASQGVLLRLWLHRRRQVEHDGSAAEGARHRAMRNPSALFEPEISTDKAGRYWRGLLDEKAASSSSPRVWWSPPAGGDARLLLLSNRRVPHGLANSSGPSASI
jgi:choline dehydrogenase-like flavoprotein